MTPPKTPKPSPRADSVEESEVVARADAGPAPGASLGEVESVQGGPSGEADPPAARDPKLAHPGHTIVRYTLMRLMFFFGCLLLFWLLGLRRPDQQVFLLLAAGVTSLVLSYFFLRRDRDTFSEAIADKIAARAETRRAGTRGRDEADEDAELTP